MADEVVTTPFGKFLIDPEDCVGGTLKAGTCWDGPTFLQVIAHEHARFGEIGTTILDVGANFGSFTLWCASRGAWRVVAVEPMPELIRYLKATLDLNQPVCGERVVLIPVAAYDKRAEVVSYDFSRRNMGGASVQPPDRDGFAVGGMVAAPLDDYQMLFGQRVSLIKIDAQGCDGAAIVGLTQTIERDHPPIVFEWEERLAPPHGYTLDGVIGWLIQREYQVIEWPSHKQNYLAVWQGERR